MSTQDLDKSIIANRITHSTILSSAIRLQQIIIASMEDIIWDKRSYVSFLMKTGSWTTTGYSRRRRSAAWRCSRRRVTPEWRRGKRAVVKESTTNLTKQRKRSSSRAERFPKTLFALSRRRIAEDDGSGDLLSQSSVHADNQDGVDYGGGATARGGKNPSSNRSVFGRGR